MGRIKLKMQKNYLAALATNPNALLSDKNTLGNTSPRAGGGSPRSGTRRRSKSGGRKGNSNNDNSAAADSGNQAPQVPQEEEKKQVVMQEIFHEIRRPDPQPLPQEPDVSIGILKSDTFMRKEFEH